MRGLGWDVNFLFLPARVAHDKSIHTSSTWISFDIRNAHIYLHNCSAQLVFSDKLPSRPMPIEQLLFYSFVSWYFCGLPCMKNPSPAFTKRNRSLNG